MSSELPASANLEYLKKQAKELLSDYRQGKAEAVARLRESGPTAGAGAKLADAQRAVAREYGFASWAKLKRHVESAGANDPAEQIKQAFHADDAARVAQLLELYPK